MSAGGKKKKENRALQGGWLRDAVGSQGDIEPRSRSSLGRSFDQGDLIKDETEKMPGTEWRSETKAFQKAGPSGAKAQGRVPARPAEGPAASVMDRIGSGGVGRDLVDPYEDPRSGLMRPGGATGCEPHALPLGF